MAIAPQAARNTFKKTRRVNLRVTERDYNQAHARAREEGIPYQTLLSTSRHTRTLFDCRTSTPMATRTFWSTTGRPSPSDCSGAAGMAHSRGQHRSTSAVIRTGA